MGIREIFKTKVGTLDAWHPEMPWSQVDMAAFIADLRQTGSVALDELVAARLEGGGGLYDHEKCRGIVAELSDADKLRLFGRSALTSAAVVYLDKTSPETLADDTAREWALLLDAFVWALHSVLPALDDRTAVLIARAAHVSCRVSTTWHRTTETLRLSQFLLDGTAKSMSDIQRDAIADVARLIDGHAWAPNRYQDALTAIGRLCDRLGTNVAETALFERNERAKLTAVAANSYVCGDITGPLRAFIEAICKKEWGDEIKAVKASSVEAIAAFGPAAKGEVLGSMAEAYQRAEALKTGRAPGFPSYWEYDSFTSLSAVSCYYTDEPFAKLIVRLLKGKAIASDRAAASLLAALPDAKVLQDLRVINLAISTMAAGEAPLSLKAAGEVVRWLERHTPPGAKERLFRDQALHRLNSVLQGERADATNSERPPHPVFEPHTSKTDIHRKLWDYYADLGDVGKCSAQEQAYVASCFEEPVPPVVDGKVTAQQAMAAVSAAFSLLDWTSSTLSPKPLIERMRKVDGLPQAFRAPWTALHQHAYELEGKSAPSAKWLKAARPTLDCLSPEQKLAFLSAVFDIVTPPRLTPTDLVSRAVIYLSADWPAADVGPVLTRHALHVCYYSIPGVGMRDERQGNACLWALIHMPNGGGVPYLARLLTRVKYPKIKKRIEAALNEAAATAGISRGELDELSVPTHDLDADGRAEIAIGDGAALLAIDGTASVAVTWRAPGGKIAKSVPAALKQHKDAVKSVKARVKEIEADLAIQPQRLQRLWLDERRWSAVAWQNHYASHPLMGAVSRRLIWNVNTSGRRIAAMWTDGAWRDIDGEPVALDGTEITLWHPIECPVEEVLGWRRRLDALGIVQPFKQAHREVYLVTDAERRTGTYSNRFAGHIVKQHQLMALARINGWSVTHRMWVDAPNDEPTHILLPRYGLVAEYWTEGAGGDDPEVTDVGAYLYLATDRLSFHRLSDAAAKSTAKGPRRGEPVRIEDVPPLALSEIMRQCDLFVGVASVANDPNWADGGQDAEHPNQWRRTVREGYWQQQAFGDLSALAETRRGLLLALLPSLAIGKVARIDGNFLRVQGKRRVYKVHLGSGNILMEPNDQYLCIVPKSAVEETKSAVRLPFEGDQVLSIILSKAALLAADDKITDPSILSQIGR